MKQENPIETASRELPTLRTERLILRPLTLADAKRVQLLAGAREIACTTLNIPYPYEDGMAEKWIATHQDRFEQNKGLDLAVVLSEKHLLIGCVGFGSISMEHARAEIGYWIGHEWWNKGYCTEAAREIVRFGFEQLGLHRIVGHHLSRNPASGRVMRRIGMAHEGHLRQHIKKWDKFEDLECYGILASES